MVVLHFTPIPPTLCCQSPSSRLPSAVTLNASLVRGRNSVNVQTAHFNGVRIEGIKQRGSMVVKASAEIDGAEANDLPSETKDESSSSSSSLSVEELPLESKLELKLQQKMKMKLAKKIRLRRKRLVRKRQLRKKGRWPPSKMRKNKNV
ncbi:50S ribosomal protein 5, chloroplastic [Helianthus annuus]|nr:50S ribosomal protein 5, chloroplastic [Helianthus annuus]